MKLGTVTRRSKKIGVYDQHWNLIKVCNTMSEAARFANVKVQNIYNILNGYKTTLNGYNFKREED